VTTIGVSLNISINTIRCPLPLSGVWPIIPPLYYIMASLCPGGSPKAVQALSLVLSIGTLGIFYWLIRHLEFIQPRFKKYCLLCASLLPSFVIRSNFISNDALAFFIGALIFLQTYLYIQRPCLRRQNVLALYLGLGLLTKGTFVFFVPPLVCLVLIMQWKATQGLRKSIFSLFVFIGIFTCLGAYKPIANRIHYGRPIVFNMDVNEGCFASQGPVYNGLKSFYDINIFKLIENDSFPFIRSYPLLLYKSFWFQYRPYADQSLLARIGHYNQKATLLLGIVPSILVLIGILQCLSLIRDLCKYKEMPLGQFNNILYRVFCCFLFLFNLLMIVYYTHKFDVWSSVQAKYIFPSFFGFIVLLHAGLDLLVKRWTALAKPIYYCLNVLYISFGMYFFTSMIISSLQCSV